jgi:glycosyltransferase involved in cell wall biosynthesis
VLGDHPRLCVLVHDLHMLEPGFYQRGKRLWFRAFLRRGLAKAALRICVSAHTKRELERRFPRLNPAHNVVVPNAVATMFAGDSARLRTRDGGHFLFVGQLERRKNLVRMLDAWAAARSAGVDATLQIVGRPGPGSDEILARAAALGRAVRVRTDVSDVELRELYAGARAMLLPSLHEGFGIPAIEAMQAGVPVLASRGTALEETAGGAALLVEPTDTEAIRAGIVALDRDTALRDDLIARGLARAGEFTPRAQAERLHDAIRERFGSTGSTNP